MLTLVLLLKRSVKRAAVPRTDRKREKRKRGDKKLSEFEEPSALITDGRRGTAPDNESADDLVTIELAQLLPKPIQPPFLPSFPPS